MVFLSEKALEDVGDMLDAYDKAAVEADLKDLKDLLEKTNAEEMTEAQVAELKAAQEKMMTGAQKLFAKMYEQPGGAQGADPNMNMGGQASGGDEAGYDDDVIDADYKEV